MSSAHFTVFGDILKCHHLASICHYYCKFYLGPEARVPSFQSAWPVPVSHNTINKKNSEVTQLCS